jgi:putative aldouronate transport system substrate-binding protein
MRTTVVMTAILLLLAAASASAKGSAEAGTAGTQKIEFSVNINSYAQPDADAWVLKYWEDKLGVKVKPVFYEPAKGQELLNLAFASGDEPDVFPVRGGYGELARWVDEGLITDIPEDLLKRNAPDIVKALEGAGTEGWAAAKMKGKIYDLPNITAHNLFAKPVIWRDDWLKKAGIAAIPEKLEDAEKAFYAFRNNDPDGNGKKDTYALGKTGLDTVYGAFGFQPTLWKGVDGKIVNGAVQPEMKNALALLAKWYKDEILDSEYVTGENKGGYGFITHDFVNGRIGFSGMGYYYHWKPPLYEGDFHGQNDQEIKKLNSGLSYAFGKPLVGPTGKSGTIKGDLASPFQCFAKRLGKDQNKLGRILAFYNEVKAKSPANFLLSYFGQEGVHYKMVNGMPALQGKYVDIKEQAKYGGHTTLWTTFPAEYLWLTYPGYDKWANERVGKYTYYIQDLKAALPSQAKYLAELDKLRDEYYVGIITGKKPVEAFDEFVKEWNRIGGEQLTKEANAWYATR